MPARALEPELAMPVSTAATAASRVVDRALGGTVPERNGVPTCVSSPMAPAASVASEDAAAIRRWHPLAESLVRQGITLKHPSLVATILAQREVGVPRSTIGRTYKVHHRTVGRILSAADALTAQNPDRLRQSGAYVGGVCCDRSNCKSDCQTGIPQRDLGGVDRA